MGDVKTPVIQQAKGRLWATLIAAISMASTPAALAQDDESAIEEIVVTATKRVESLQDVGISVTAFSGNQIDRMNVSDSTDLLSRVANLNIVSNQSPSTNANVFIRGVGSTGISFNLQSGVGFYSDEVVLNSPVVNVLQLYDLERVEVLRGPQNTLYGRNTTGGAVNYISKKPEVGGEANGFVSAKIGRFSQVDLEAAYGAPIGDSAAFRVAVNSASRDGIRTNQISGRDDQEIDKKAVRAQLAFEPSDNVSINFKAHVERVRDEDQRRAPVNGFEPDDLTTPCQQTNTPGACATSSGFVGSANWLEISSDLVNAPMEVDASGASANITIDFENFTLTSITGYEENEQRLVTDADATPSPAFHFFLDSEQDQISQEFRLASNADSDMRWMVGAYHFNENQNGTTGPLIGTPMGTLLVRSYAEFENTSTSAYGDLEFDVSERVTLKVGLRFGTDKIEGRSAALLAFEGALGMNFDESLFNGAHLPSFPELERAARDNGLAVFTGGEADPVGRGPARLIIVGGPTDPGAQINDTSWDEWGGTVGADFQVNDDVLVYGKWSRGYKSGRFNQAPMSIMNLDSTTGRSLGDTPVNPEIVEAYEVGIKSEFADGHARLNASLFFNDYTDQQINQFINGEFTVVNADSEIFGGEIELTTVPTDGLFIDVALGFLDTEVKNPTNSTLLGEELPYAPDLTGRVALRKDWDLANDSLFSFDIEGRYANGRWFNLANTGGKGPSYFVSNAQLSYQFGSEQQYRLSLWGKNIFDEEWIEFLSPGGTQAGADAATLSHPRTYGLSFRADF